MSYLTQFQHDLFISYTHIDDVEPIRKDQIGWVSQFQRDLLLRLKKKISRKITIWRDREIQPTQTFADVTKKAVDDSAIFLALTSPNYLLESPYCEMERQQFFEKAQNETPGLKIGIHYRIVNILLYNIPHEEWPSEYGQGEDSSEGFPFFELNQEDPNDTLGLPIDPFSEAYKKRIDQLSNAIRNMLIAFKLELESRTEDAAKWEVEEKRKLAEVEKTKNTQRGTQLSQIETQDTDTIKSVFICYRRKDSQHITGRICDRLKENFGRETIFMDVDSIPLGVNFRHHLNETIKSCKVVLVVIGEHWLSIADEATGKPRLKNRQDHVRIEIESTLRIQIPLIPILVQPASMPIKKDLPTTLKDLTEQNGLAVRPDPDFHGDMDRLIEGIEAFLNT